LKSLELEQKIGYCFKDKNLLERALTHSSYLEGYQRRHARSNERLEFLGDAFFDAIISEELCRRMKDVGEGELTKTRAKVVCEKSLADCGFDMDLGQYLFIGKGEKQSGGCQKVSIVADATEALIGAIYIDGGYEAAQKFVLDRFGKTIDQAIEGKLFFNYKSELQEKLFACRNNKEEILLKYEVEREEGPDHDKTFFINLYCNGRLIGKGSGKSKKQAEINAAKEALEKGGNLVF